MAVKRRKADSDLLTEARERFELVTTRDDENRHN
jgi:hypothetical protein